jgi:hypothetical protein
MDEAEHGTAVPVAPAPHAPARPASPPGLPKPQSIAATFQNGVLHPHTQLPLFDGEEVELEIRRKK